MKLNILFVVTFLSVLVYASADFITGIVGATQLNGEGCTCHSLTPNSSVNVWIEGPDTVAMGETVQYGIFLEGGPSVFGGFNVAAMSGDLSPADTLVIEIDDELTHDTPLPFPIAQPSSWVFNYTPAAEGWDTLYSAGNSVNGNNTPSGDEWNFGDKFPLFVTPPVPVELVSFSAASLMHGIQLFWTTASEINNSGFEVERISKAFHFGEAMGETWEKIGFVSGFGTTSGIKSYSFVDKNVKTGYFNYRLKQIDFDGSFEYSNIVSVEFIIKSFILNQNYPNPFNPVTKISFSIPEEGYLTINIYNIQGELVEVLSDGIISSGNHSVNWDASSFTSGVYFYQFSFESENGVKFSEVKKMILAK